MTLNYRLWVWHRRFGVVENPEKYKRGIQNDIGKVAASVGGIGSKRNANLARLITMNMRKSVKNILQPAMERMGFELKESFSDYFSFRGGYDESTRKYTLGVTVNKRPLSIFHIAGLLKMWYHLREMRD